MKNNFKYFNLGYYFNKGYYKDEYSSVKDYFEIEESSKTLTNWLNEIKYSNVEEAIKNIDGQLNFLNSNIEAKINYPGLIVGMGYAHNSIKTGEFQNGFSFDYTTGIPIIPGSTVKGIIRDAFPIKEHLNDKKIDIENIMEFQNDCFAKGKLKWLKKILNKIGIDSNEISDDFIFQFEKTIFGDENNQNQKVVFFDAYPIAGTVDNKLLGDDYITKHENPLKNPVPLRILKILPGVTIKFNFLIKDISLNGLIISKEKIENLFGEILKEFGVGARRSVGYGNFLESSFKLKLENESKKKEKENEINRINENEEKERKKQEFYSKLKNAMANGERISEDEHIKILKEFKVYLPELTEKKEVAKGTKNKKRYEYYHNNKKLLTS